MLISPCPVQVRDLDPFLDSLFGAFASNRKSSEGFGDWVSRVGLETVREKQQQVRAAIEAQAPPATAKDANGAPSSNGKPLVGAASS